jgi:hypothetical protein
MQLITAISVAAAMATTVSATNARTAVALNKACDTSKPHARIYNNCPYEVNLWSVYKGLGCPTDEMVTLQPGDTYAENYANPEGGPVGVSIKLSKTQQCKDAKIAQLEYFIEDTKPGFNMNFLDVSYVDCPADTDDCPTRKEGFRLVSGSQTGVAKSSAENTRCPILECNSPESCNLVAYVDPYDNQTKTCGSEENMDFYMCGEKAPYSYDFSSEAESAAPSTTLQKQTSAAPKPTATETADSYAEVEVNVAAAAVTPAPKPQEDNKPKIKTEVVYVTAYETVVAKRHAHGHARRHAPYNA